MTIAFAWGSTFPVEFRGFSGMTIAFAWVSNSRENLVVFPRRQEPLPGSLTSVRLLGVFLRRLLHSLGALPFHEIAGFFWDDDCLCLDLYLT